MGKRKKSEYRQAELKGRWENGEREECKESVWKERGVEGKNQKRMVERGAEGKAKDLRVILMAVTDSQ